MNTILTDMLGMSRTLTGRGCSHLIDVVSDHRDCHHWRADGEFVTGYRESKDGVGRTFYWPVVFLRVRGQGTCDLLPLHWV